MIYWTPDQLTEEFKIRTDRGEFYVTADLNGETWSLFYLDNTPSDIIAFYPVPLCTWLNRHEAVLLP